MKVQVTSHKMPRVGGKQPRVGDVLEMDLKYGRAFLAAGFVKVYTAPAAEIPASPSVPLSVVTPENAENNGMQPTGAIVDELTNVGEALKTDEDETARKTARSRRYNRRDMQAE